jgi:hypothetical protein
MQRTITSDQMGTVIEPFMAQPNQEIPKLDSYFCAPKTLRRLRAGPSGTYIDGFADSLERDGYAHASAVRYLRVAAHLGWFAHLGGGAWAGVDAGTLEALRSILGERVFQRLQQLAEPLGELRQLINAPASGRNVCPLWPTAAACRGARIARGAPA